MFPGPAQYSSVFHVHSLKPLFLLLLFYVVAFVCSCGVYSWNKIGSYTTRLDSPVV